MREIKFRFWGDFRTFENNEEEKVMLYGDTWAYEEYEPINKIFKSVQENVIVMQYTGLKDKNDNEIYEGDIVKYFYDGRLEKEGELIEDYTAEGIATIIFDGGCFMFNDNNFSSTFDSEYELEVIGNIYENPELKEAE